MNKRFAIGAVVIGVCLILLAVCIGALAIFHGNQESSSAYQRAMDAAEEYYESGNLEMALSYYWDAVEADDTQEEPYLKLAEIYEAQGNEAMRVAVLNRGYSHTASSTIYNLLYGTSDPTTANDDSTAETLQSVSINTTLLTTLGGGTHGDYIVSYGTPTVSSENGVCAVTYANLDAVFYYDESGGESLVNPVTNAPYESAAPSYITLESIGQMFNGYEGSISYSQLSQCALSNLSLTESAEYGQVVSFTKSGCSVVITADEDGTIASGQVWNQITPVNGGSGALVEPSINVSIDYTNTQNAYTSDCKVRVVVTATDESGNDATVEYASSSAQTGYYGVGTYTVQARTVSGSSTSEWATKTFSIGDSAPTVSLSTNDLDSDDSTTNSQVTFTAYVSSSCPYRLSSVDYYNQGQVTSTSDITKETTQNTITDTYSSGQHLLVVQVKDLFGETAYDSYYFVVGSMSNTRKVQITSLYTEVTEEGMYSENGTPLAYISSFGFHNPAIPGHSTGCTDAITIYGVTASGTTEQLLSIHTNNGYVSISSNGSYEYTDSGTHIAYGSWSGWDSARYTQLIFHYQMASGHEDCIARATEGLYYTVQYAFISENSADLESLFD